MAPLLYPGATRIKGAYKVYPYLETEFTTKVSIRKTQDLKLKNFYLFLKKTKRKIGLTDETLKVFNNLFDRNLAATPLNKKDGKSGVEKKEPAGKKVSKNLNLKKKISPLKS